jgi:hypothetical protein
MGDVRTRARELAARYRARAAETRARLPSIRQGDLRMTFLQTAETYEALAHEVEQTGKSAPTDRPRE